MFSSGSCIGWSLARSAVQIARSLDRFASPNCTSLFAIRKLFRMDTHDLIRELREPAKTKIVLLVADGLGGLPLARRAHRTGNRRAHPTSTRAPRTASPGL